MVQKKFKNESYKNAENPIINFQFKIWISEVCECKNARTFLETVMSVLLSFSE